MHKVKFAVHLYVRITIIKVALVSNIKSTHVQVSPKECRLVLLVIGGHGLALVGYASNVFIQRQCGNNNS